MSTVSLLDGRWMRPFCFSLVSWTLAACVLAVQLSAAPRGLVEAAQASRSVLPDLDRLHNGTPSPEAPSPAILCAPSGEALAGRNPVRSLFDVRFKPDAVAARYAALLALATVGCRRSTPTGRSAFVLSPPRNLPLLL
jgi:hypothetical protein